MNKYNWVVSDLDGTIIAHTENGNIIYESVVEAINEYINNGNKFSIATGRHYKDVISIVDANKIKFKDDFFIIGMNGSQIYSWGQKKLIFNSTLPNDKMEYFGSIIENLLKKYNDEVIVFGYGENENIYTIKTDGKNFQKMFDEIVVYEDNEDTFNYIIVEKDQLSTLRNITKFVVGFDSEIKNPEELIMEFNKISSEVDFIQSGPSFVEMMPKNINKASAIDLINNTYYKINKENIMALGDSGNDIEMLAYAGKSITRQCAPNYVKQKATDVLNFGPSIFVEKAIKTFCK